MAGGQEVKFLIRNSTTCTFVADASQLLLAPEPPLLLAPELTLLLAPERRERERYVHVLYETTQPTCCQLAVTKAAMHRYVFSILC